MNISDSDSNIDVQTSGPLDCRACDLHRDPARPGHACLSHTCPDCGHPTHALLNDRNELAHRCPICACSDNDCTALPVPGYAHCKPCLASGCAD